MKIIPKMSLLPLLICITGYVKIFYPSYIITSYCSYARPAQPGPIRLVGCFGLNGPLRQYFSLYRAVSQREGERKEMIHESQMYKQPPSAPTASAVDPCPTLIHFRRTLRHWKSTQHHCATRPPLSDSVIRSETSLITELDRSGTIR